MAKINLVLKGSSEPKKIYYRYRPSRNFDINGATPFEINSNDWDKENQCWDSSTLKEINPTMMRQ